jgi:hypothetical protein
VTATTVGQGSGRGRLRPTFAAAAGAGGGDRSRRHGPQRSHRLGHRASPALAVLLTWALCLGACTKPAWLADLEHKLDVAVPQLTAALDHLTAELPAAVAKLDAVMGRRLAELNAELRDSVDGLNVVLGESAGHLDAALAARVEDLARYATSLAADVHAISLGLSTKVSASVDTLLRQTQLSARRLLATLGAQIERVEREGNRTVAAVHSEAQDTLARLIGAGVVVVAVVAGALILLLPMHRRRPLAFALQMTAVTAMAAAGAVLLASSAARARFAPTLPIIVDHTVCPTALASAADFIGGAATAPVSAANASELLPRLAACQAFAANREQYDAARAKIAAIRQLLGIPAACLADRECHPGQRCDLGRGVCDGGCDRDAQCVAGLVCHPANRSCAAPCGTCPAGSACQDHRCVAPPPAPAAPSGAAPVPGRPRIDGGRGEDLLLRCAGDPRCLERSWRIKLPR